MAAFLPQSIIGGGQSSLTLNLNDGIVPKTGRRVNSKLSHEVAEVCLKCLAGTNLLKHRAQANAATGGHSPPKTFRVDHLLILSIGRWWDPRGPDGTQPLGKTA